MAVVARPDAARGEKLIAVTNEPRLTLEEVRAALHARGLSNLAVPREIKLLRDLPRLGTGKVNHPRAGEDGLKVDPQATNNLSGFTTPFPILLQ